MSEAFKQRLQDLQDMQKGISPSGTTDTVYLSNIGGRYSTQPGIFDVGGTGNAIKFYSLSDEEKAKAIRDINQEAETKRKLSFLPFFNTETTRINPGLISQQNTNSTTQSTNTVTNKEGQNNNQVNQTSNTSPQNIFGERLAQAFFPGIPQSNKDLINAAILRGSLELLKPRQPGENLASQLGRGLEAGTKVGADVQKRQLEALTTQAALLKAQQTGKQVSVTKEKRQLFEQVIDPLYNADPEFRDDLETLKRQTGDVMGLNDDTRKALELEAMTINARTNRGAADSMRLAVKNYLSGNLVSKETDSTEDKFSQVK